MEVFPNSNIKVWRKCKLCGHEWKAAVHSRNRGVGCPRCAFRTHTSFPEQVVYYYIKQVYADAINGYKNIEAQEMELDIYIPSQKNGYRI